MIDIEKLEKDFLEGRAVNPRNVRSLIEEVKELQEKLQELTICDLCADKAVYHLFQAHLDKLRFPDIFSTEDGDYPDKGRMVLFSDENDTYIGGFDGKGFIQDEDGPFLGRNIKWCYLLNLEYLYEYQKTSFSHKEG
jgi:hypothetical protein